MAYALPPSSILYPHAITRWRVTDVVNSSTGKPGAQTWAATVTGQACYFQTGQSAYSDAGRIVLNETDIILTLDTVRFPSTADISVGDVLKQTTGPESGRFWAVRGEPRYRTQFGSYFTVEAARLESAPSGVS